MARNQNRYQNLSPVYAVIGAGDLAVEKIRELGTDVQERSAKIHLTRIDLEPKQLRADIEAVAKQRADEVRAAQLKAQQRAEEVFNEVVATATTTYDSLAGRGKQLVDRIRRQPSTQATKSSASTAKSQTKAATTTAKKSASTTSSAARKSASNTATSAKRNASNTASTAQKSTAQTRSRAKGAGTSTRKTAQNAGTAASQAAKKVGD
jgi:heparin binding hemagglutinin HbhA